MTDKQNDEKNNSGSNAGSAMSMAVQLGFQIVIGPVVFFAAAVQGGKYFGYTTPFNLVAIVLSLVWMIYQSIRIMGKGGK